MAEKYINRILTLKELGIYTTDIDVIRYFNYLHEKCEHVSLNRVESKNIHSDIVHIPFYYCDIEINRSESVGHINHFNELIVYDSLLYYSFKAKFELKPKDTYFLLKTFLEKILNYDKKVY